MPVRELLCYLLFPNDQRPAALGMEGRAAMLSSVANCQGLAALISVPELICYLLLPPLSGTSCAHNRGRAPVLSLVFPNHQALAALITVRELLSYLQFCSPIIKDELRS